MIRGIRGAITTAHNQADEILQSTQHLLEAILQANPTLSPVDIASAFFTVTADLNAAFPAQAARAMGWSQVPLMCAQEIEVPGSLPFCIRVLVHWNTALEQSEIKHIYLGEAIRLRPDLSQPNP